MAGASSEKDLRAPEAQGGYTMLRSQRRQLVGPRAYRSRLVGTAVGMLGGTLVAVGTFLPWLELNGRVRSGWEIFGLNSSLGQNPAAIHLFGVGNLDFFTGLVTLTLGVLSLLLMGAVLLANTKAPRPNMVGRTVLAGTAALVIATALVVSMVDLWAARLGTPASGQPPINYGLWVTFAGGLAGTLGMAVSFLRKPPPAPERPDSVSVSAAPGPEVPRNPTRTLAILLLVAGLGGFVIAALADGSHASTAVADERSLAQQNPVAAAQALRTRVTPVKSTFDTYAAASAAAVSARDEVNNLLQDAGPPADPRGEQAATAKARLPKAVAAYAAALGRERAARKSYVDELALLMQEVHR